jgi:tetratricopeptide (TPR) repeat protein
LAKRKRKKQRKSPFRKRRWWQHQPAVDLEDVFEKVDSLVNRGRAQEAVALLEPLLARYPYEADLHYHLGYARVKAGDFWAGLSGYERALELKRDPGLWLPLASNTGSKFHLRLISQQ